MMEHERIVTELLTMAARAASAIMRVYATDFGVDFKEKNDPVTVADREANGIIVEALGRAFPGVPVVAEESDASAYAGWQNASSVFFVDPLDGTRDFVKKNGEFVVMIGLAEDGRAKLGAIHAPATGRAFAGGDGIGAFELLPSGERKPLRVSETRNAAGSRLVISRSRPSSALKEVARALGIEDVTELGSAGLKGMRVASGVADVYAHLERAGSRWDACAPEAIVRGAGGITTDSKGKPIDYRGPTLENDTGLLISNGHLHEAMLAALNEKH